MSDWKLFTAESDSEGHDTHPTREDALDATCHALRQTGRWPPAILRIEGPNGEIVTRAQIDVHCAGSF